LGFHTAAIPLTLNPSPTRGEGLSRRIRTPLSRSGREAGGEGQTPDNRECLNPPVYCYKINTT